MQERFTSQQVIGLTGITARQLQWWDERGVVNPKREGHRRLYSMSPVTEIGVICGLRRKGFSLQRVRKVLRFLDRELGRDWRKSSITTLTTTF
jgi:DNA-binding transcriptional MerR regulator